ncbi:MAG: DUF3179 domain-containing protein, partial [Chloroflexi bacterium]|nr:DUF3179 domain-containing protein [Chloroflexota bacterium]
DPLEPVIALEIGGQARAYPIQILIWHEIVTDDFAGVPLAVTFCPLCNSAIVFDRRLDGVEYTFGVSGNLRDSDLIMWDRETESWWQQFTGQGIVGVNAGKQLAFVPAQMVSWASFKAGHPDSDVLSLETGFDRNYGRNPYSGYDRLTNNPFLFDGDLDERLSPKERVAAVNIGGEDAAFPFSVIEAERVVNYMVGGTDVAVFFEPGTVSALDSSAIASSKDVGAVGIFIPEVEGQRLTFVLEGSPADGLIKDEETGSTWSILGHAIDGPLAGAQLERVVHQDHFWFAWAAFKPLPVIYRGAA